MVTRKSILLSFSLFLILSSILFVSSKGSFEHECPFEPQAGRTIIDFGDERIVSYIPFGSLLPWTENKTISLPAGYYDVSLFAWDGYAGRESVSQPKEQYKVLFWDGDNLVAESSATPDLEDGVEYAEWYGQVNTNLLLSSDVNKVQGFHAAYFDASSPNSLNAGCVAFDFVESIHSCPFEEKEGRVIVDFENQKLRSDRSEGAGDHYTDNKIVNLPAGYYNVSLFAWDGFDTRTTQDQYNESYKVLFYDSSENLVAESSPTPDLQDGVNFVYFVGQVDANLLLSNDVTKVQGYHTMGFGLSGKPNSLNAGCAAFDIMEEDEEEPVCGNGILEEGEECDFGIWNGFLCWAKYGTSCDYCTKDCKLKTLTNYCGDGIKQPCEECDFGPLNGVPGSGCTIDCKLENGNDEPKDPICDYDVGVRYSYGNSYGTGIAIRPKSGDWIEETPANLSEGIYEIRYIIDNHHDEPVEYVNVKVGVGGILLESYNVSIINYHIKSIELNTSRLCGAQTIYLETGKFEGIDCNPEDNYAEREIYVYCEDDENDNDNDNGNDNDIQPPTTTAPTGGGAHVLSFWECEEWSVCSAEGIQKRVCVDLEGWEPDIIETRTCIPEFTPTREETNETDETEITTEETPLIFLGKVTDTIVGALGARGTGGIVAAVVFVGLVVVLGGIIIAINATRKTKVK